MKQFRRSLCLVLTAIFVPFAFAETDDPAESLVGEVEVGYRSVNVDGNQDKYREQVNLSEGVRLFKLDLNFTPKDSKALDELVFEARDLGGDPFSTIQLRARKVGRYDLRARYRTSDYFYRDAGYFFSATGDVHTWDSRRKFGGLDFRYHATRWLTLRVGADRVDRDGGAQTTRHLDAQQGVFPLSMPLDQTASSYWLGLDAKIGWADLTVEQRYASYENRWLMTGSDSTGVDPTLGTVQNYEQLQVQDGKTPVSRIRFGGMPFERLRFNLGYARMDMQVDYEAQGDWTGDDSQGISYGTDLTNFGQVERTYDLWDVELSYGVLRNLDIGFDAYRKSYDQEGEIDYRALEQTAGAPDIAYPIEGTLRNQLSLDAYRLYLGWRPTKMLALTAGAGWQVRDADFELAGPEVSTERTVYRAGLRLVPNERWDLQMDYETGSDEDPYTVVSHTDLDRLRVRARVRPVKGLGLTLHYKDDSRQNSLTYALGKPTDDDPAATDIWLARFDVTGWGIQLDSSNFKAVNFSLGYNRNDIVSDAHVVFVTGFIMDPQFDFFTTRDRSDYTSDQEVMRGMLRANLSRSWEAGVSALLTRNRGTLPLDWDRYRAWVRWSHSRGIFVSLQGERYSLREDNPYAGPPDAPTPDVNDYDADLLTVSLGYAF